MHNNHRGRLILHGSIVMFVGLIVGLLEAVGLLNEAYRGFRTAYLTLTSTGIWILAIAAVFPSLFLPRREASVLVWSLLATGYGVIIATPIEAITGIRAVHPGGPITHVVAFIVNVIILLGASLAILLTLSGARAALKGKRTE